jgi:hypothetical protein
MLFIFPGQNSLGSIIDMFQRKLHCHNALLNNASRFTVRCHIRDPITSRERSLVSGTMKKTKTIQISLEGSLFQSPVPIHGINNGVD